MVFSVVLIIALAGIDRALKIFLSPLLSSGETVELIPGFIRLTYAENTGAGFSILTGHTVLLSIFTTIALCAMLYFLLFVKGNGALLRAALVLIIAGGFGNLYDRVFNGFVFDYLEFTFFSFPVFNFADCMITVGAGLLILFCILPDKRKTV